MKLIFVRLIRILIIALVTVVFIIYIIGRGTGEREKYNLLENEKVTFAHRGISVLHPKFKSCF